MTPTRERSLEEVFASIHPTIGKWRIDSIRGGEVDRIPVMRPWCCPARVVLPLGTVLPPWHGMRLTMVAQERRARFSKLREHRLEQRPDGVGPSERSVRREEDRSRRIVRQDALEVELEQAFDMVVENVLS